MVQCVQQRAPTAPAEMLLARLPSAASPSMDEAMAGRRGGPDLEDVRRSLDGDKHAYGRLIDRHERRMSSLLWRFSRDPEVHKDLLQEVFIEAYQSLRTYRAQAPFEHWLTRIAMRVGYRYWKRQERERTIETVPIDEWDNLPDEQVDDITPDDAADLLQRLLVSLPARDRLVLTLRYIEGLSVAETAERTGWSRTMVNVQAWRARRKLRALFHKAREEVD